MGSIKLEHINKTYGKDVIIPDLNQIGRAHV